MKIKTDRSVINWFLLLFLIVLVSLQCAAKDDASKLVKFAVNPSSVTQLEIYHILARKFESQHSNIKVQVISHETEEFKKLLVRFNQSGSEVEFGDVILSYAGSQLSNLVHSGNIVPLDEFWRQNNLQSSFSVNSQNAVTVNGSIYALPLNYYQWGIYYKKSIFRLLNVSPPDNWSQLLEQVRRMGNNGVIPFCLSLDSSWTLAAWFDHLNLRLNGLQFHQSLLAGNIEFTDPRVTTVFEYWKQLIDAGAFGERAKLAETFGLEWRQSLPYFYRNLCGMNLMGNFFMANVPDTVKSDIGFFAFPQLDKSMPRYENVPLDIVVLNKNTKFPNAALSFIAFLSQESSLTELANYVGKVSPHINSQQEGGNLVPEGKLHIESAAGFAQYFDRDTTPDFAQQAFRVFKQFVNGNLSILEAQQQLDAARKSIL